MAGIRKLYENESITPDTFEGAGEISGIEFIDCTINNCIFFEWQIIDCIFTNCTFTDVNMAMCKLNDTQLNKVTFQNCKIMGVNFNLCRRFLFEVGFNNCILDYSSFEKIKMNGTEFTDSSLKGVDFAESSLEKAIFNNTNLEDTIFFKTNLKGADLSLAYNYRISPTQNNLKKAIFSENGLTGLLSEFDILII